ncbi:hypothetical protein PS417_17425 [Pseudomonas simiae]|uniref:Uncharacterized protein n=1 Tax=Pseudomonas simiae TaxID=321846 RepID=A0A1N7U5M1_9PSED|nr:hypothetical protein PS417_17425 [Pseudomonas simiae]
MGLIGKPVVIILVDALHTNPFRGECNQTKGSFPIPHRPAQGWPEMDQRLAKYMVTSKPIRRSVKAGLVHIGRVLLLCRKIPVWALMHGGMGGRMLLSK